MTAIHPTPSPLILAASRHLGAHPRVLIAEDDGELRRLIAGVLRQDGLDVIEATDGFHMLDLLAAAFVGAPGALMPDMIISDIRMPGPNGIEILAGLRASGFQIPILLMTAFGDDETHTRAYRSGADAVLDKPVDTDDLLLSVWLLLATSKPGGPSPS
jgi:CheY-like chemotaxis protein